MLCPRCQHGNPPQGKFCLECGVHFALHCPRCGTQLPAGAKFCLECGQALGPLSSSGQRQYTSPESYTPRHLAEKILTSKSALEGERKQVTVLFADLKGSMELLADRDPEEARKLLDPVLTLLMEAVHRYEGTVNQVMGDGIMALFGAPLAHEDHAVRACYAALAMQAAIRRYADQVWRAHGIRPQIRVGLDSGEVVVRAIGSDLRMDYSAVGQTTHLAARMEQLASPRSITARPSSRLPTRSWRWTPPVCPRPISSGSRSGGLAGPSSRSTPTRRTRRRPPRDRAPDAAPAPLHRGGRPGPPRALPGPRGHPPSRRWAIRRGPDRTALPASGGQVRPALGRERFRSFRGVEDLASGRFLGQCGLNTLDELGEVEILYALERVAWGRGLATEAGSAALAFGFDEARLPRIIAVTRPEHRASRGVMEKLGMRYERDVEVFGIRAVLYALARDAGPRGPK